MKQSTPNAIFLKDYQVSEFLIDTTHLTFDLQETQTQVSSHLKLRRNPLCPNQQGDLILNGSHMELLSVRVDGQLLNADQYLLSAEELRIPGLPAKFELQINNLINPKENLALEGLFMTGAVFCTQNEPEGFRRMTYFIDRSDVMSIYTTKVIADKKKCPVLLSNGNPINKGDLPAGKHFVEWHDPFPKPTYLFALVAGNLGHIHDFFMTRSGRKVALEIYCDVGNEGKCLHAMESLKKAMKWDEETFGLEYDLDIYMIVATDSFNLGAMENKGLNIFNSRLVLANPETATDQNYASIEGVIGHEYFHNWTGNRITCRDWFQLTLKEGLTVFRDQEFSADLQSRPVQRINDVDRLRQYQFPEDEGPMSHPIRPPSFIQINNFYTPTIYEKGAEVIRMIHTMIGKEKFRKGMDLYFKNYDGQAVTCEDFIKVMSIAGGKDFNQFMNWYNQAGTPEIDVSFDYQAATKKLTMVVEQKNKSQKGQETPKPFHFPLSVGFLDQKGQEIPSGNKILEVKDWKSSFVFNDFPEHVIPSINRNFSAPIKVNTKLSSKDLAFLFAYDTDDFNRRESGQILVTQTLKQLIKDDYAGKALIIPTDYLQAIGVLLKNENLDLALKALALRLPSEVLLFQEFNPIPFEQIHHCRDYLKNKVAQTYRQEFLELYRSLDIDCEYHFDAHHAGRRELKNICLSYLCSLAEPEMAKLCYSQFERANNMTDKMSALNNLCRIECSEQQRALDAFYRQWHHDKLVMQMWLSAQAWSSLPNTLEKVKELMHSDIFDLKIPNCIRALIGAFGQNHSQFHAKDGSGFKFMGSVIKTIDGFNPSMASSLSGNFKYYQKLDSIRKEKAGKVLQDILLHPQLSKNTYEIISRTLV